MNDNVDENKRGRGRPKSEDSYNNIVKSRFNDFQLDQLVEMSEKQGKSKSDILREAFDSYCRSKNGW